ncbi:inorganic pyrophosphatase [Clostridium botulinum]|uniref:inorganic diphosphatase n=1 Tax=Clostridium botulinum TaxID=1491 RepID=UPI001967575E|nr:inorganic diphosphatase [Clostridium botulinum]MBN1059225.1 inorganic pyrophosphatase [Clostridium botulinum]MBN1062426.1 inorganic pyrophosphatase [Clostridium botulinum]MBN1071796.1 inorganic pyrophosphatase [Clostridium botulinum]
MESYLGKLVTVKIDRPLGSKHPKYNFIYSLNYGFLPNTTSGDGEEIDVYIIGEFKPLETYKGYVVAIIKRTNDIEDKLVACKELNKYNKEQIKGLVEFQERFFESTIITY